MLALATAVLSPVHSEEEPRYPPSIKCSFKKSAFLSYVDGKIDAKLSADPLDFILSNLNTDEPLLTGNAGTTKLLVLKKNQYHMFLIETVDTGVNIISVYFNHGAVSYSKQYDMLLRVPIGSMLLGTFEVWQ
jgi:hypothetical protein